MERESTSTDRRATYAVITPAGLEAQSIAQNQFVQATNDYFFSHIPRDMRDAFASVLEALMHDPTYCDRRLVAIQHALDSNPGKSGEGDGNGQA